MKLEYKIFNMSEASVFNAKLKDKKQHKSWLDFLNKYGGQGWQVVDRISKTSYLMVREIPEVVHEIANTDNAGKGGAYSGT